MLALIKAFHEFKKGQGSTSGIDNASTALHKQAGYPYTLPFTFFEVTEPIASPTPKSTRRSVVIRDQGKVTVLHTRGFLNG